MDSRTEKNRHKAERLITALFNGARLNSFSFNTSFTLKFYRTFSADFEGCGLPMQFEINLFADWWFGTRDEWYVRVNQFNTSGLAEPDEPVKAFELARLRGMKGSVVDEVEIEEKVIKIHFQNGRLITISLFVDMDYAWFIEESGAREADAAWSLICENGELYVRTPNMRDESQTDT